MFKKITLGAAAALTALTAMPSAAQADSRDGYYRDGYYSQSYRGDRYSRYDRHDRYDRYDRRDQRRYSGRYYRDRCENKGTTGTIVGAIAGGLLGREVAGHHGDRTVGTIIGGAAGALAGRAIDKNSSNRC